MNIIKRKLLYLLWYTKVYFYHNNNKKYYYKKWSNKKHFWCEIFLDNTENIPYIYKQYTRNWKVFKVDLKEKRKNFI